MPVAWTHPEAVRTLTAASGAAPVWPAAGSRARRVQDSVSTVAPVPSALLAKNGLAGGGRRRRRKAARAAEPRDGPAAHYSSGRSAEASRSRTSSSRSSATRTMRACSLRCAAV